MTVASLAYANNFDLRKSETSRLLYMSVEFEREVRDYFDINVEG